MNQEVNKIMRNVKQVCEIPKYKCQGCETKGKQNTNAIPKKQKTEINILNEKREK
jgi:hypothetical protein